MHELHAVYESLHAAPATIRDLIDGLPGGQLTAISGRTSDAAQAVISSAHHAVRTERTNAGRKVDGLSGWHIEAPILSRYVLIGHLYPSNKREGRADPASPVVLLDRFTRIVYYDPEVPEIAHTALANRLAWTALSEGACR